MPATIRDPFTSGALRELIELVEKVATADGLGGKLEVPTIRHRVRASVLAKSATEQLISQGLRPVVVYTVVCRRISPPPTAQWQIRWKGKTLELQGDPIDPNGRGQWLQMAATEIP